MKTIPLISIYVFILFDFLCASYQVFSEECLPSNPSGVNENTLCIQHYIDHVDPDHIDFGSGFKAHYGQSTDPLRPNTGNIIQEKRFKQNEYFTEVTTGDQVNGIKIKTNKGRTFKPK